MITIKERLEQGLPVIGVMVRALQFFNVFHGKIVKTADEPEMYVAEGRDLFGDITVKGYPWQFEVIE